MLQHNSARAGQPAHIAHAAMLSLHAICCGAPTLLMLSAAASGAASVTYLFANATQIHSFVHAHEIWVLAVSAAFVAIGGALEAAARRRRALGFPWLFSFSVACFLANVGLILFHRGVSAWA